LKLFDENFEKVFWFLSLQDYLSKVI
jgi:hypothetical protein